MSAPARLTWKDLVDEGSFSPEHDGLESRDPLSYPGYREALQTARNKAGTDESVVAGAATFHGYDIELAAFEFGFMGGSMGEVAGERLARAMERAAERDVPFVLLTASGGARMQEGMRSLIQMPKVLAARFELSRAAVPFIAVLGHPTTGGVLAGIGGLADVTIALEGATIGFAGPRVVETMTGNPVDPVRSHSAASALNAGLVDYVESAEGVKRRLDNALRSLRADEPEDAADAPMSDRRMDAWEAVEAARSEERPSPNLVLGRVATDIVPLRGDRAGGDDTRLLCALARIAGRRTMCMSLAQYASPGAAALRKARRCIEIAERLRLPVVTLIDTPGADPSPESENSGVAWEMSRMFESMLALRTPSIAVVTGEGGSGGALAFAVTDVLLILEDAIFSVIGPEAAAAILWRDSSRAPEAAALLKPTAHDLLDLGIADAVLPSSPDAVGAAIAHHLARLGSESIDDRAAARRRRWRRRG